MNNVIDLDYAVITLPAWYRQLHIDVNDYGKIINLIPGYPHNGFKNLNQIFFAIKAQIEALSDQKPRFQPKFQPKTPINQKP